MVINLLSREKQAEWKLTEALQSMFISCELKFAKYKFYDFHEECRGNVREASFLEISQNNV